MLRALIRTRRLKSAALPLIIALAGCTPTPTAMVPEALAPEGPPDVSESPTSSVPDFGFPASIDPASRYLFYLHGKIIEDQGIPAVSPEFGEYEYEAILRRLREAGLIVISEQRARDADVNSYAGRIKDQVGLLKQAGVPSEHITVTGASKGAYIAALSSYIIRDPSMNFVLLATCYPAMVTEWTSIGMHLYGNVLAIHDIADEAYSGSCEELFQLSEGKGLGRHQQIVLQVGTGHGIVYHPLDEWILPTLEWAGK